MSAPGCPTECGARAGRSGTYDLYSLALEDFDDLLVGGGERITLQAGDADPTEVLATEAPGCSGSKAALEDMETDTVMAVGVGDDEAPLPHSNVDVEFLPDLAAAGIGQPFTALAFATRELPKTGEEAALRPLRDQDAAIISANDAAGHIDCAR